VNDLDLVAEKVAQGWATIGEDYPLIGQAVRLHRNTRRGPMSFLANPSLVEMYADFPRIDGADVCKAVQTGVSELVIQLHLEAAGWRGRIAALVLPTYGLRDRFVQRRIDPLFLAVPEYREKAGGTFSVARDKARKGTGNLKLKDFGDGALLFLGSNADGDFLEFSADLLTIDEYDGCVPANVAKARDRLRNSPYPQLFRIGNPEEGKVDGIAAAFDEGDRRLFHWRCGGCGERQPIDWWANVVHRLGDGTWEPRDAARFRALLQNPRGPDIRPVCRRCSCPFNRDPDGSAWVAERPGRRRSYRMTRLDVITDRLWDLFVLEWLPAQGKRVKLATFYRSVLGLSYQDAGAQLTMEHLEGCATGPEMDLIGGDTYRSELVVAGIDVGSVLNVVVDAIHLDEKGASYRRSILITAVPSFEAVRDILNRYHVQVAVIDARPETRKAQELRDWALYEQGHTFVWLCQFFPTDRVGSEDYGRRLDYTDHVVTVDRTQLLDATFDEVVGRARVLPMDGLSVSDFVEQMKAPARVLDEKGSRFIWSEGSKPDHYRLADAYARVAADLTQVGGSFVG
jgi:hypothetical protein